MKKAISLMMALMLCLGLCACGGGSNSKYVGTYEGGAWLLVSVSEPYNGSTLYKDDNITGKRIITLNSDGTGTVRFTPTESANFSNKAVFDEMCNGTLVWQVDDDYVTITFHEITYVDASNPFYMSDIRREVTTTETFELKGAQLVSVSGSRTYTKVN